MNYADKLKQFNSTEKYKRELEMLGVLLGSCVNYGDHILDYGCGLGAAMKFVAGGYENKFIHGYDVQEFIPGFKYAEPDFEAYGVVYFMHSLAHIPDVEKIISELKTESIVVITPNKLWLESIDQDKNYTPDPTVIKHFYQDELIELFESLDYEVQQCGQFGKLMHNNNERLFLVATKIK